MKELILIRGPSEHGKTYLAYALLRFVDSNRKARRFSADDFFTRNDGSYHFDPDKLPVAHEGCQFRVESAMRNDIDTIIVDNTFTRMWEMKPYLDLAKRYSYDVGVIRCEAHRGDNNHCVPDFIREKQAARMEDYKP